MFGGTHCIYEGTHCIVLEGNLTFFMFGETHCMFFMFGGTHCMLEWWDTLYV